ncbi:dTTP/UTP pyrophosphatase [Frankliniella fusca]|uniref:dTTP/UTP pyrophosphatase n=1 Tax=Frankliniella fusca TaxID=407009 RepID=A0AAE1HSD4_9NEOP|nr:dTTP/UTP pyrophosphatase [Frankliniella fusca]
MGEEQEVNKMLYFMGGKANDILATFKLTEEDKKVYLKVKERFDSHCIAKKTKMYMRGRFNIREQKEGESVDQYITELHTLGKKCEYGAMTDELVRDRLIVGISNKTLSLQLQNMEKELTLEEVIDRVSHAEVVLEHQRFLQPQSKIQDISQVQSANNNNNNNTNSDVINSKGKKKKNFKKNQEKRRRRV